MWGLKVLIIIWASALGAGLASFLKVVVSRTQKTEKWVAGRSHCDYCSHQLRWYENIPVLSFILQGGNSRCCHKPLSWTYLGSEMALAVTFAGLALIWLERHY